MTAKVCLVLLALCIAQVFAIPTSKTFTADLSITEKDDSVYKVTWNYDVIENAERIVYHRGGGLSTINYRLYSKGLDVLVIEGAEDSCHILPLSETQMPSVPTRAASFAEKSKLVSWTNIIDAAVDSSVFALPSSCNKEIDPAPEDGIFCSTCVSVGNQVIGLGCNATSAEIAKICGSLFGTVCAKILDMACTGACNIETCSADACCLVGLCSGSTCGSNSTTSSSGSSSNNTASSSSGSSGNSGSLYAEAKENGGNGVLVEDKVGDSPFCSSCLGVGAGVIALGCNATSAEVAHLCGSIFLQLCDKILETFCSGACNIEDCSEQACCLVKLCSGSQCTNGTSVVHTKPHPQKTYSIYQN